MYNKVILERPIKQKLKLAMFLLIIFTIIFAGTLLLLRAISVKDYNGNVNEVTGELEEIIYVEENNVRVVVNGDTYIVNPIRRFNDNLNLEELLHQNVTLYVSQTQVGKMHLVLGLKHGDQVLADYKQTIDLAQAENRETMIVFGVVTGVLFVAVCGVYVWRMRINPTKEYDLAEKYAEFNLARQPSCPEYKKFFIFLLVYMVVFVACTTTIAIVCEYVDNETVQIAVGASLGGIAVLCTVGLLLIMPLWLLKKEREFYAKNFPFDFSDVSHVPMRKKYKKQLQEELNAERTLHPHRYGDGGNGYTVEFSETGLKIYDFDDFFEVDNPTTEDVFGVEDAEHDAKCLLCTIDYKTLNFEALPFYRKTHHPLMVVVKSRLTVSDLPNGLDLVDPEKMNDVHIILDSNLLASLRHFDVAVENLDYILDNKKQLIAEHCGRFAKNK